MKLLTSVVVGLLLLTGCSSEVNKELKYDELDLITYQRCLDNLNPVQGAPDQRVNAVESQKILCDKYLPVKK